MKFITEVDICIEPLCTLLRKHVSHLPEKGRYSVPAGALGVPVTGTLRSPEDCPYVWTCPAPVCPLDDKERKCHLRNDSVLLRHALEVPRSTPGIQDTGVGHREDPMVARDVLDVTGRAVSDITAQGAA